MIIAVITFGQNQKQNMLQEIKCTPPKFTGVEKAIPVIVEQKFQTIEDYMAKNVSYPEEDRIACIQGTEVAQFVVSPTGDISNIKIINSVSKQIDAEVIRVLESTKGMWKPGYNDDKPVAMEKEVSLVFKVDGMSNLDFNVLGKSYFTKGTAALFNKSKPQKALRYFDQGITLLPSDKALLVMRGLARYETGNKDGALQDWNRVKTLGGIESTEYLNNFNDLKGYAVMTSILVK
jgi:tetratricopeptide (TPR) repeat protein